MISLKELNPKSFPLTPDQEANLAELHRRINVVRKAWALPMIVTSGFRSLEDHRRIYKAIALKRGMETIRIPMGSLHLKGAACDISDPKRELQRWCLENEALLAEVGLWLEDFSATRNWCHFQIYPPKSGKRWFKP